MLAIQIMLYVAIKNQIYTERDDYLVQEIPSQKHFAALEQIHNWLDEAGFVIEQECGDYQGHPISEMTNRAIIWARKVR